MSEMAEMVARPQRPIMHVVPGIYVRAAGMSVETTEELTVVIVNDTGSITLSQRQFEMLLSWSGHISHQDWE